MQFSLTFLLVLVCILLVDCQNKDARGQREEDNGQLENYRRDHNKNNDSYYGRSKRSTDLATAPIFVAMRKTIKRVKALRKSVLLKMLWYA